MILLDANRTATAGAGELVARRVEGLVLGPDGRPYAGAEVQAGRNVRYGDDFWSFGPSNIEGTSGDDGSFALVGKLADQVFRVWAFDGDGKCADVPYAKRIPPKASVRSWPIEERDGLIMAWMHKDGEPPSFELPAIPEYDSDGEPIERDPDQLVAQSSLILNAEPFSSLDEDGNAFDELANMPREKCGDAKRCALGGLLGIEDPSAGTNPVPLTKDAALSIYESLI